VPVLALAAILDEMGDGAETGRGLTAVIRPFCTRLPPDRGVYLCGRKKGKTSPQRATALDPAGRRR